VSCPTWTHKTLMSDVESSGAHQHTCLAASRVESRAIVLMDYTAERNRKPSPLSGERRVRGSQA
jgi:hypothetical protein